MPITQDRLLTIIRAATAYKEAFEALADSVISAAEAGAPDGLEKLWDTAKRLMPAS